MKKLGLFCAGLLLLVIAQAQADGITICRDPETLWPRFFAFPVYETDEYELRPSPPVGGQLNPGNILLVDGYWTGPTLIRINKTWYSVDWRLAYCDFSTPEPEAWKPGAPTILMEWKDITTDCAHAWIDNHDGGWSLVTEIDGSEILLHYGEDLIGGHSQSIDPADYRLEESLCYDSL